jgi:2-polyprenyl-3-methyl-5-hydroxy-6-metoxy-1,4-benzoquinol methylase
MTACADCEFVFNSTFDPKKLEYGAKYDNSQICSPFFEGYVDDLVRHLIERGVRGTRIVEIGCGKGHFLKKLVEANPGNTGIGFDEAYDGPLSDLGGRLHFRREFYEDQAFSADVIVCRHVIEHLPDPPAMLRALRASCTRSDILVFFETPALEWILEHDVVWDFFYEHCSLFTARSLFGAFRGRIEVDEVKRLQ